jgi:hypothetical protein
MRIEMMHSRTALRRHGSVLLLTILCCCGCGARSSDIQGKVALAGQPINIGAISFLPADGHGPTSAAKIIDGQYSARVLPGNYKVQISGFRKAGQRHASEGDPNSPMMDILEPIVPERYNTASTLVREIKPGVRQLDFLLD